MVPENPEVEGLTEEAVAMAARGTCAEGPSSAPAGSAGPCKAVADFLQPEKAALLFSRGRCLEKRFLEAVNALLPGLQLPEVQR